MHFNLPIESAAAAAILIIAAPRIAWLATDLRLNALICYHKARIRYHKAREEMLTRALARTVARARGVSYRYALDELHNGREADLLARAPQH